MSRFTKYFIDIHREVLGLDTVWTLDRANFTPQLNKRQDIINWLVRIMLTYAYPAQRDAPNQMREFIEPNLTELFHAIKFFSISFINYC